MDNDSKHPKHKLGIADLMLFTLGFAVVLGLIGDSLLKRAGPLLQVQVFANAICFAAFVVVARGLFRDWRFYRQQPGRGF